MIFEARTVYTSDEDGDVRLTHRIVRQACEPKVETIAEAEARPLIISGLRLGDVALWASLADESGVTEAPFFVTEYANEDTATIVSYELVQKAPSMYVTRHLAQSLQSINESSLDDLEVHKLTGLIPYIDKRFPRSPKSRG